MFQILMQQMVMITMTGNKHMLTRMGMMTCEGFAEIWVLPMPGVVCLVVTLDKYVDSQHWWCVAGAQVHQYYFSSCFEQHFW